MFGAVLTSMQKSVLERPVLREIVPSIVFVLPAVMAKTNALSTLAPADLWGGKDFGVQRGNPHPLVSGGLGNQLPAAVMILCDFFLGPDHCHRLRIIFSELEIARFPNNALSTLAPLDLIVAAVALFAEADVGWALAEQAHGVPIQIAPFLFEGND